MEISKKYPQKWYSGNIKQPLYAKNETCKAVTQELYEYSSEGTTENSTYIFSLIISCKLNNIAPQDYLKHLFECILHGKDSNKRRFCHVFINRNVKSCGHFYFIHWKNN